MLQLDITNCKGNAASRYWEVYYIMTHECITKTTKWHTHIFIVSSKDVGTFLLDLLLGQL